MAADSPPGNDNNEDILIDVNVGPTLNEWDPIMIASDEARSIGWYMLGYFRANVQKGGMTARFLLNTFREQDLEAVIAENPELFWRYQARIRELIADPFRTEYGHVDLQHLQPESGYLVLTPEILDGLETEYCTGREGLVALFGSEEQVRNSLGADQLSYVRTPKGRVYGILPEKAKTGYMQLTFIFYGKEDREVSYRIDEIFGLQERMRDFAVRNSIHSLYIPSDLASDKSLITNDRIVSAVRTFMIERAKQKFRDYILTA